jgi:hypothetical protein
MALLVTARRGLPAARRLKRQQRRILAVEVVSRRYSLASMRHLEDFERDAMAPYPLAAVSFDPGAFGSQSVPCPDVQITLDGMPRAVLPGTPQVQPAPDQTFGAAFAAANALAGRYGRTRVLVAG